MKKRVKRIANGKPLTARQRKEIAVIAAMPDSEIDFSDIPRLPESFWKNAVRNPFYRPVKRQVTVRLDADVIAWLRRQGKGYQTRLNCLLRAAMLQEVGKR
ncbi:MAG TPA: BrnA antitoxin family protein [Candidatus Sulfotelmatobacter sp.]|nr:BrnA antitoxin family protein [Candidatus Sulfotelmatobacter sp.]